MNELFLFSILLFILLTNHVGLAKKHISQFQTFHKIVVLKDFFKIHRKTPVLETSLKKRL